MHSLRGRIDFVESERRCIVGDLSLEIGQINLVIIGDGDGADARARQVKGDWRSESARAYDQRMRIEQPLLTVDTKFVEKNMARIAQQLFVVHNRILGKSLSSKVARPDSEIGAILKARITICAAD